MIVDALLSVCEPFVFFFAVIFPLMVSAVADVHFLRFKQVFIVSLPTALYDFHTLTHTYTHYPQSPNLEDRKLSLSPHVLPAYQRIFYFILVLVLVLIFIFHTPLFHDLPVFDDIFRAPKWQNESEEKMYIVRITQC